MFETIVNTTLLYYPDLIGVYLYGSYARGTETDASDIDLCILMPENTDLSRYDFALNYRLTKKVGKQVGVVFCTQLNEWCKKLIYSPQTTDIA